MRTIELGYLFQGAWKLMRDGIGVYGKGGVRSRKRDGTFIGADFIRIDPGCGFLPHIHDGDHILHVLEGRGIINFDGNDVELYPGNLVFIPAEYPHAMSCPPDATTAMTVLAIGHPHHEIFSHKRSQLFSEIRDPPGRTPPVLVRQETDSHS